MALEGSIQVFRKTAAEWLAYTGDPLLSGQPGLETDTGQLKFGDGVSDWVDLDYVGTSAAADYATITGDAEDSTSLVSYVQGEISTVIRDQGNYDASSNLFPTTGGSGALGAIEKGNQFTISVSGTLGGTAVTSPYSIIRALVDTPGQTASNWFVENRSTPVAPTANFDISSVRHSGKYYTALYAGTITSSGSWNAGFYTYPVIIGEAHSISGIRFRVTTGIGSSTCRVALWAANSVGYPSTLLADTGEISTATNGEKTFVFSSNIALSGKIFFFGFRSSIGTVTVNTVLNTGMVVILERASGSTTSPQNYFLSNVSSAPADPFTAGQTLFNSGMPVVEFLRV